MKYLIHMMQGKCPFEGNDEDNDEENERKKDHFFEVRLTVLKVISEITYVFKVSCIGCRLPCDMSIAVELLDIYVCAFSSSAEHYSHCSAMITRARLISCTALPEG